MRYYKIKTPWFKAKWKDISKNEDTIDFESITKNSEEAPTPLFVVLISYLIFILLLMYGFVFVLREFVKYGLGKKTPFSITRKKSK